MLQLKWSVFNILFPFFLLLGSWRAPYQIQTFWLSCEVCATTSSPSESSDGGERHLRRTTEEAWIKQWRTSTLTCVVCDSAPPHLLRSEKENTKVRSRRRENESSPPLLPPRNGLSHVTPCPHVYVVLKSSGLDWTEKTRLRVKTQLLMEMNGSVDGSCERAPDEGAFLFTSESVGEGHPGEWGVWIFFPAKKDANLRVPAIMDEFEECAERRLVHAHKLWVRLKECKKKQFIPLELWLYGCKEKHKNVLKQLTIKKIQWTNVIKCAFIINFWKL